MIEIDIDSLLFPLLNTRDIPAWQQDTLSNSTVIKVKSCLYLFIYLLFTYLIWTFIVVKEELTSFASDPKQVSVMLRSIFAAK